MGNQLGHLGRKTGEFNDRLLRAVSREDIEVIRYLVKKKDTDLEHMEDGTTALSLAVNHWHKQIAQILIAAGAKVTSSGGKVKVFPLYIAIVRQATDIVELLIECGSDVNIQTEEDSRNLLHVAIQHSGEGGTADWRSEQGWADMSQRRPSAQRSLKIIDLLIRAGVNYKSVDSRGNTIMHYCSEGNHVLAANYFLDNVEWLSSEALVTKNNDGDAPIHIAIKARHEVLANMLIQHGFDMQLENEDGSSLLVESAKYECVEVVKTLLTLGSIDVNKISKKTGETALHASVHKRNHIIPQILLKIPGVNVNMCDGEGMTAIHIAARRSDLFMVNYLISYKAKCDICDKKMRTPLYTASFNGQEEVVKSIINSKLYEDGYIDRRDVAQKTALLVATSMGHESVVRVLMANNADVNVVDKFGNSPLYQAVQMGHNSLAEMLIQHGADVDHYNDDGRGALHAAVTYPKCDVIILMTLLEANCDPVNLDDFLDFLTEGGILDKDDFVDREKELIHKLKYNPKPLKHWCRCSIRERLPDQKYKTELRTAIQSLHLPNILQIYLNVKFL